jgi:AcrR family transcriptional regulator
MQHQTEDERASFVAAAWTVLERAGFEGFKVQLLLRETGLSARAFYRHFADKDELLVVLMQDEYSRSARRAREAVAAADDPPGQVAAWIDDVMQAANTPQRAARARLFTSQPAVVRRFPEQLDAAARLLLEPLEDAIRRGHGDGVFPWADPPSDAKLILQLAASAMVDALADRADPGVHVAVDDAVARVTDFALRALGSRH